MTMQPILIYILYPSILHNHIINIYQFHYSIHNTHYYIVIFLMNSLMAGIENLMVNLLYSNIYYEMFNDPLCLCDLISFLDSIIRIAHYYYWLIFIIMLLNLLFLQHDHLYSFFYFLLLFYEVNQVVIINLKIMVFIQKIY